MKAARMLRIAICDDEKGYREDVKAIIEKRNTVDERYEFYEYDTGRELVEDADIMHHIIFLDVHMPKMDGNEASIKLREKNDNAVLVFCTNYQSPTPEVFRVQPFRYVMKDMNNKQLVDEIDIILDEARHRFYPKHIIQTSNGGVAKINISDILYISRRKRGSTIHIYTDMRNWEHISKDTVDEHYQKLRCQGFEFPHNSYIVNLENIERIKNNTVILKSGKELNISRSRRESFDTRFMNHIGVRYRMR